MFLFSICLLFIVGILGGITFVSFLISIFSSLRVQHLGNTVPEAKIQKWSKTNIKANFIKNVFWQWTIYVFAACSFVFFIVYLLGSSI
jgi:hypothetical protein